MKKYIAILILSFIIQATNFNSSLAMVKLPGIQQEEDLPVIYPPAKVKRTDHPEYGVIEIYSENDTIVAIAHKVRNDWTIFNTVVTKYLATGDFSTKSNTFKNGKRSLRETPVMPHPPIVEFLKTKIVECEAKKSLLREIERRLTTPEPIDKGITPDPVEVGSN